MLRHFCCRLTPSGIGDQLSQLNRLHDLGRRWGLEYVYRPLPRNRWSPDFDADDFLGLGLGERRLEEFPEHTLLPVDGAAAARALREGRPLQSLLPRPPPQRSILELVHSDEMYARGATVGLQHPIDLREKLLRRHGPGVLARSPIREISVCVHVRQGDCTWVRRGDRYVFLGMRKIAVTPQDVDLRRAPAPDAYAPVLAEVAARLAGRRWSLTVFSDGPTSIFPERPRLPGRLLFPFALREPRLIGWLRLARDRHPLHAFYNPMCDPAVAAAYRQARTGLQRLVAPYPQARLVIGTNRALTEQAIVTFASADIAVLGRSRLAFPLLGLGDPARQAVLLLDQTQAQRAASLDQLMAKLGPEPPEQAPLTQS